MLSNREGLAQDRPQDCQLTVSTIDLHECGNPAK